MGTRRWTRREGLFPGEVLLPEGHFIEIATSPRPASHPQLGEDSISSSESSSVSLTTFSLPLCVLLSFLIENFYLHSLKLQKGASFGSWAVPGPCLHVHRARFRETAPWLASAPHSLFGRQG